MQNHIVEIEEVVVNRITISAENENAAVSAIADLYESGNLEINSKEVVDVKFGITKDERRKQVLLQGTAIIENGDVKLDNDTFVNNLVLIDSTMPPIFEYLLKKHIKGEQILIGVLTKMCAEDNICNIKMKNVMCYYRKKVTDMLYAILHGMNCDEAWNGQSPVKSIYIFNSGVTFSLYDRVSLIEHLWENAYIEIKCKINTETKREIEWAICI
jgi:hypothetical protein